MKSRKITGPEFLKALFEAGLIRGTTRKVIITAEMDGVTTIEETYFGTDEWINAVKGLKNENPHS